MSQIAVFASHTSVLRGSIFHWHEAFAAFDDQAVSYEMLIDWCGKLVDQVALILPSLVQPLLIPHCIWCLRHPSMTNRCFTFCLQHRVDATGKTLSPSGHRTWMELLTYDASTFVGSHGVTSQTYFDPPVTSA